MALALMQEHITIEPIRDLGEIFPEASVETFESRADWLKARQSGLGASDAAAILGYSTWSTPFKVWAQKMGRLEDEVETEAAYWGRVLEPAIATRYAQETGRLVGAPEPAYTLLRSRQWPFLVASLDRVVLSSDFGPAPVELKTAHFMKRHEWLEDPPGQYLIQLQMQMAVCVARRGSVAGLLGGQEYAAFDRERDDALIAPAVTLLERFWRDHILTGTPPQASGQDGRALSEVYALEVGGTVTLPPEAEQWDRQLVKVKGKIRELEGEERTLENQLKSHIGEATIGLIPATGAAWHWPVIHKPGGWKYYDPTSYRRLTRSAFKGKKR
jgi:putative phage-type endonuclease